MFRVNSVAAFGLLVGGTLWLGATPSSAAIVISDTFTRTGALNGTAPDVGAGTWTAAAAFNTTGSTLSASPTGDNIATLAFVPTANSIITLSADVSVFTGDWIAIGFSNSNLLSNGNPWVLLKTNANIQAFKGPGTGGQFVNGGGLGTSGILKLVENTSTLSVSAYFNTTLLGTTTLAALPATTKVEIRTNGATGTVDNFTLDVTSAVPEPASLGLLASAAAGLLARRRARS